MKIKGDLGKHFVSGMSVQFWARSGFGLGPRFGPEAKIGPATGPAGENFRAPLRDEKSSGTYCLSLSGPFPCGQVFFLVYFPRD